MSWRQWTKRLYALLRPGLRHGQSGLARSRGQVTHVLILDGTMSSLVEGDESNAGLTYKLLSEMSGPSLSVYYEAGLQWQDWRTTPDVMMGRGINRQIRRAYGYLASRYRAGDRIFLFGYSRGAYAVRSLAGVIDRVGLLKAENATVRNIVTAYRHYQSAPGGPVAADFKASLCHEAAPVEMVGVWDTVKALGLRLPMLWRWSAEAHAFHNHRLGPTILHGFHALALDETRTVFEPVLWSSPPEWNGRVEQVWFRGTHGDVGGQLGGFHAARPLSNIPLVWMLERAESCALPLPEGWRTRFPTDPEAPSVGTWRGWGKVFLLRGRRRVGQHPSERLHETVGPRDIEVPVAGQNA
ncbi:putative alpha/beta hydrolase family protein DUF2235 [Roseovarius halotolerans]|uniref:T6SS Phospholipase effector Tle1-like catalytic domain-containing protein n=1 Tax=Roseovarius halotolerans TaxID=505353 RepID=A0A1X6Y7C3_9RHOB|nr:DUF2235 domain-containing protein [Roseovarius halotolerans]RKT35172.1 putative alpha/beta hydrolase family protein DUF2235 [Roseovarius halotolerans]SLN12698.1 hypothetical protein ROH8110_00193 [Roseovarius halotolerans]